MASKLLEAAGRSFIVVDRAIWLKVYARSYLASWSSEFYQHDAAFEPPGSNMLVLFDNGQRRVEKEKDKDGKEKDKEPNSRGQVWKIDERARTATLVVNADLGVYAPAMGAAHRLSNGNYHFTAGTSGKDENRRSKVIEVPPQGKIV